MLSYQAMKEKDYLCGIVQQCWHESDQIVFAFWKARLCYAEELKYLCLKIVDKQVSMKNAKFMFLYILNFASGFQTCYDWLSSFLN